MEESSTKVELTDKEKDKKLTKRQSRKKKQDVCT